MEFAHILKANPYHDEQGRFTSQDKAKFVSVGGVFDKQKPKDSDTRTYSDVSSDSEFSSHGKLQSEKLTPTQIEAINDYSGRGYVTMNNHLRKGTPASHYDLNTRLPALDEAINGSSLGKDVVLYRSVKKGAMADQLIKMHKEGVLKNTTLQDKGFTSTTTSEKILDTSEVLKGSVRLHINANKESKGLFIGFDKKSKKLTKHPEEKEVLLPRNGKMRVRESKQVGDVLNIYVDWLNH